MDITYHNYVHYSTAAARISRNSNSTQRDSTLKSFQQLFITTYYYQVSLLRLSCAQEKKIAIWYIPALERKLLTWMREWNPNPPNKAD